MAEVLEHNAVISPSVKSNHTERSVEYYLHERYKRTGKKRLLMWLYYMVRPIMPRSLQLAIRRMYAKKQARVEFPAWPIEPILVDRMKRELREQLDASGENELPIINFWPGSARAAVILTHDVEWGYGAKNIPRLRELEKKYGVVSSWNFVPERYTFDKRIFKTLSDEGCEIGVHGLYHDGNDLGSRDTFTQRLPRMNAYLKGWNAAGFRSPATHRNPEWMPELAAEYDSSFPDTDPFEPQSGGCCSIFPFFLKDMVELPITMPQDHTLIEILLAKDIGIWKKKASWIIANHGLVNIIIHPDYMLSEQQLWYYEEFLKFITSFENIWFALPRDAARWWRNRSQSEIVTPGGIPVIQGPAADEAVVIRVVAEGDSIEYRFDKTYKL